MNVGLFQMPLSLHTKTRHSRLNQEMALDSNHIHFSVDVQQFIFFGPNSVLKSMGYTPLAYVHKDQPPLWNLFWTVWLDPFCPVAMWNCVCIWAELAILSWWAIIGIYWSSVAVVACGWPCPGRLLTFPVSWNRFHTQLMTRLAIPTPSATLLQVCPD